VLYRSTIYNTNVSYVLNVFKCREIILFIIDNNIVSFIAIIIRKRINLDTVKRNEGIL